MSRDVYLISYDSPIFPAHWGLWIPSTEEPNAGKVIQVLGDPANGFDHEFIRNYNPSIDSRTHRFVLLGKVKDKDIVDVPVDGTPSADKIAVDDIERNALAVPAPGKSLNSSSHVNMHLIHLMSRPDGISSPR